MKPFLLVFALLLVILTGCGNLRSQHEPVVVPTVADINALATAQLQTQNAPPEGFRESVSFPLVDQTLNALGGWHYVVGLEFDGTFTDVARETTASASAEVWFNQAASARRVMVSTSGELLGRDEATSYEAVRLGPDAFLVEDGACLTNAEQDAQTAADLTAGELVGGVNQAVPVGRQAVLNGEQAWLYTFTTDQLNLPAIALQPGGTILANGELWVAPAHNAVVRYYATIDVTNARIFGRSLPVNGRILLRYDLYEIGEAFNITTPFGC